MKAGQVIGAIIGYTGVKTLPAQTCDIFTSGTPETEVTGVVTTFMATVEVIQKAIQLGANMIVTHEPTYFTGGDKTDWLSDDPVYLAKKKLMEENNLVIWRCHDRLHMAEPDGIYEGLLKELEWEKYRQETAASSNETELPFFSDLFVVPKTTLRELSAYFKEKLHMDVVQLLGDPDMACSRVGILVGGGSLGLGVEEMPMRVMRSMDIDVMVCGEITEWTLCAYVNDAKALGMNRALLIVGHERSEEWGMKHMAGWLRPLVPEVPVTFVDAKEPFSYL